MFGVGGMVGDGACGGPNTEVSRVLSFAFGGHQEKIIEARARERELSKVAPTP